MAHATVDFTRQSHFEAMEQLRLAMEQDDVLEINVIHVAGDEIPNAGWAAKSSPLPGDRCITHLQRPVDGA